MTGNYALFWLVLLLIAISNGVIREFTYGRKLTELRAHQLSTLIAILLSGAAVYGFSHYFPIDSERTAIVVGAIWLMLTVAFECVFGRFIGGYPWKKLVSDYNLLAGRVWLIFLLWLSVLPYIVYRMGGGAV